MNADAGREKRKNFLQLINHLTVLSAEWERLARVRPSGKTGTEAPAIEPGIEQLQANLRTSFDDGSDDLVEYATLIRDH
ncbi:hypothetical protein [Sphingomonas sp. GB1N7]|uniref:hypothetical protein n=1 Tax=Parasphingomonas caseinilytica TaxID=3096158 RepID=UPI002FC8F8C9